MSNRLMFNKMDEITVEEKSYLNFIPFQRSHNRGFANPEDWVAVYDARDLTAQAVVEYIHLAMADGLYHGSDQLVMMPKRQFETVFRSLLDVPCE